MTHLWDYVDGQCCEEVAARIVAHVPACSPCARHLVAQEQFLASLARLGTRLAAPTALHETVRNRLAAESRRWRFG